MQPLDFSLPTRIVFGEGRLAELPQLLDRDLRKILVVSDAGGWQHSGAGGVLTSLLDDRDVALFREVEENPSHTTVAKGAGLARAHGSRLVIGLGGGSPMDAAKAIAVLVENMGDMSEVMVGDGPPKPPLPIVCIPTTSGTGSEATPFTVLTDPEQQSKGGFAHPTLFPRLSLIDPELTWSMPEQLVINTGLDVLTHAIEAFLSTESSPLSDLVALQAIDIVLERLEQAAGKHHDAMSHMAYAAMLGGIAIAHAGTILLHVMSYPLTVFHGVPHGRATAILLPAVLRSLQQQSTVPDKVAAVEQRFQRWGSAERFLHALGVSTRLSDYGVHSDELDSFVAKVIVKDDLRITPATVTEDRIRDIYETTI